MNTTVKATNFDLSPAISDYIDKKVLAIEKLIDSDDTTAQCAVEIGKPSKHHQSGDIFYAELNVTISGNLFRATAEEGTIYAAIDKAKDDVVRELRRYKKKRMHLLRRGGAKLKDITQGLSERGARIKGFIIRDRKNR